MHCSGFSFGSQGLDSARLLEFHSDVSCVNDIAIAFVFQEWLVKRSICAQCFFISQACLTNANLLASVRRCSVQVNDICILYIYI